MNENELIERFFDSRDEMIRHQQKAMTEFGEWIANGEPDFVPPSDETMAHEAQQKVAKYDDPMDFIRKEALPEIAQQIGFIKTTVAGAFLMRMVEGEDIPVGFYDEMEMELAKARIFQDGYRRALAGEFDE